jgi:hypothetical protein
MHEGTDPSTLYAVGAVGVFGTLTGVFLNDLLTRSREKRAASARQKRAVSAVVGELLDAVSILHSALSRQAWWPPGDSPRDRAWEKYGDDLAQVLDDEQWNQVRMTYETLRSLDALRDVPQTITPSGSSPSQEAQWGSRWPDADSSARDSYAAVCAALEMLRPFRG